MFRSLLRVPSSVLRTVSSPIRRELTTGQSGVDKALLSKLRKKTGYPFIKCKKALDQFNNDIEQAEKWLREQAQKEGWAKASKLQNRPMSQGLVGVVGDQQQATMVEVNCETDFVARNAKFVSLVSNLTLAAQEHFNSKPDKKTSLDSGSVGKISTSGGQTLADLVAMEVGNIGENMALRRAVHLRAGEDNFLSSYVHLSGPGVNTNSACQVGKFGAVLEIHQLPESDSSSDSSGTSSSEEEDEEEVTLSLEQVGQQLGQHVVGMNPKRVGEADDKQLKNEDEEKNKDEGLKNKDGEEKNKDGEEKNKDGEEKNQDEEEKNKDGEEKNQDEEEKNKEKNKDEEEKNKDDERKKKDEEDTLILQEFLLDPSMSVKEMLKKNHIEVRDFVRYECGEDLGEDSS